MIRAASGAGEEALRFQVERLLDSVDAVIYLLDYTKLRTAEEASIFERIKSINPGLVKRLSRRWEQNKSACLEHFIASKQKCGTSS